MDAAHFRQRAARAREMAQFGDDLRLSRMLLEVALDLDAEAETIEAASGAERRDYRRLRTLDIADALLHLEGDPETRPVNVVDLSARGARIRAEQPPSPGSRVVLELPSYALSLDGVMVRVRGSEAAIAFDPESATDPRLTRLLRSTSLADPMTGLAY